MFLAFVQKKALELGQYFHILRRHQIYKGAINNNCRCWWLLVPEEGRQGAAWFLYPGALATTPTTSSTSDLVWKVGLDTSDCDHAVWQAIVVFQVLYTSGICSKDTAWLIGGCRSFPYPSTELLASLASGALSTPYPQLLFLSVFALSLAQLPLEQWRRTTTWAFYEDLEEIEEIPLWC